MHGMAMLDPFDLEVLLGYLFLGLIRLPIVGFEIMQGRPKMSRSGGFRTSEKGWNDVQDVEAGIEDSLGSLKRADYGNPRISTLDWMGLLNDETPLPSITVPGTHDSAAFTISWPFVSTQKLDFRHQLDAGIRYFDLRCAIRDDIVEMVHGPTFLGLTLASVFETMYTWLSNHPSEALVVQIKRDRRGQRSKAHMSQAVFSMIASRPDRWRTENTVPLLGMLRGKIQLFRRFEDETLDSFGVDVTVWADNRPRPFTIRTHHGVLVTIQDHYSFVNPQPLPSVISRKGGNILNLLRRAASDSDPNHWYINFTSAYELNFYHQLPPRQIAVGGYHRFKWVDGVNLRLRASLMELEGKKKRLGIIAMDFPELGADDLITAIIQANFSTLR